MTIGVLKEPSSETRVSLLPEAVATLTKKGIIVCVEKGAGSTAFSSDETYIKAGASIGDRVEIISKSDIILVIQSQNLSIPPSKILIGVYQPLYNPSLM